MSGAKSRRKGATAERELFHVLNKLLGACYFKRNLDQSRNGGADDDPTIHPFPVAVEVKNQAKLSLTAWYKQADEAASALGKVPCVAFRQPGGRWTIAPFLTPDQFASYLEHTVSDTALEPWREVQDLMRSWK